MDRFAKTIEYLFYFFVFLLPIQTCYIWQTGQLNGEACQYLTYCLYGSEILLWLVLLLSVIYKLLNRDWEISYLNYKSLDFYILFLLLLITAAISLFFSADKMPSMINLLRLFEGLGLLVLVINFKFSFFKTASAFVLAACFQSGLAIFQFLSQYVFPSKWLGMAEHISDIGGTSVIESGTMRWLRAYGTLPHPNILAGYLAIAFLLLVVLIILAKNKNIQLLLWAALPILLSGLFFTFSKNGFVALAVGLAFLGIFILLSHDRRSWKILGGIVWGGLIVISLLAIIYKDPLATRLMGENRLEVKSFEDRTEYWAQAKKIWEEKWLTGVGLGNYTLALYDESEQKLAAYEYQPVHNVYLLVAIELGIFGFIVFMLIIILALRRIYKFQIDTHIGLLGVFKLFAFKDVHEFYRKKLFWFLGCSAVFFCLLVLMMFDHYLWTQYFGVMLWWLCLGMFVKTMGWVR